MKSFLSKEGVSLQHYIEFFSKKFYLRSLLNTLMLGILTTAIVLVIAFAFAYLTTRGPSALRKPLKIIALLPLIAPSYIFAISLIILMGKRGVITQLLNLHMTIYGWQGVILAQSLSFLPLAFMMIENVLTSLNPNLEDSAADLGAKEMTILKTITIPLSAPGFLKAGLLVFVMAISEFGNPAILGGRLSFLAPDTFLMITGECRFEMASVLSVFLILPSLAAFMIHHYWLKGKTYTTIVGKAVAADPRKMSLLTKVPCFFICSAVSIFILLSFSVIVIGSFVKLVGINNTWTWEHFKNLQSNYAIFNSIKISLLAGLVGAIIGILLSYVIMRGNFRGRTLMEFIALSGFAVPGTVLGVGYILAFNSPPLLLTGTIYILIFNNVFRFLAVAVEAGVSKLHQISIEIEEASADLGADFLTTFRRVVLPILFSAFVVGFIYIFMTSLIALSSVIFLVKPGYDLAAVYIFITAQLGEMGLASATMMKLILIIIICMGILYFLSKKTGFKVSKQGV